MRVLVCRPLADSETTAARLVGLGHEPVIAPVLTIETRPLVLPSGAIDATLATSRHAFTTLSDDAAARLRRLPLYAVGEATARAARGRSFDDVRIGQGDARALADLLVLTMRPGATLLYLAGEVRKDSLAVGLEQSGYIVTVRETYAAIASNAWPAEVSRRLRTGALDVCLHFSRRSAELAIAASATAGVTVSFGALHHVCLSAEVAVPLQAQGWTVVVAAYPREDSLLQVLSSTLHRGM